MRVTGKRQWVYAASIKGKFQVIHRWSGVALQAILFLTPWVMIGGHPALRVDLPGRRLFAMGEIFAATDTVFLVLIGLFLAFGLFFFTSLFGRLWCGFLCPQTVFLEEWVRQIERRVEGERGQRMARDKGPWTWDRAWRKVVKWTLFALLAFAVGMTLVSYFAGAKALWTGQGSGAAYGMVGFFSVVMFLDFAWFREQFCNFLCPYARFQGALTDDHSLVISYDTARGEPRSKRGKDSGACIDCNKCVVVCPAGIDIRDGYQLECIACARCVDACHSVMEKRNTLPSLVLYTTEAALAGKPAKKLRGRTAVYGGLLATLTLTFAVLLQHHHTLEASVGRAPGTLFAVDPDGAVRNTFLLRVANNHPAPDGQPALISVAVEGLPGAEVLVQDLQLGETESTTVPLIIRLPPGQERERTLPFTVRLRSDFDELQLKTTFKTDAETGEEPADAS